jgi:catecholate siderophore receptor
MLSASSRLGLGFACLAAPFFAFSVAAAQGLPSGDSLRPPGDSLLPAADSIAGETDTMKASGGTGAHPLRGVVVRAAQPRPKSYRVTRSSSATRTDAPLRDTPQSVTVVSSELISDNAMQSLGDVVRYVPGITMGQGEGHRDQPTIRGNNTTADFFVNGVRDDAQFYRDLYNVDRVEALKGPNAMVFGRGGGGGVINRVLKEAEWVPHRAVRLEGGAWGHRRATLDMGHAASGSMAFRVNAMTERSGGYRDYADLDRRAINPTASLELSPRTLVRAGFEHLYDRRVVDRGIPSFDGAPALTDVAAFFGNPAINDSRAVVNQFASALEHATRSGISVRNRTQLADYDKFYGNSLPGAVNAAGTHVAITAYSDAMRRRNAVNQTDLSYSVETGALHHSLLFGTEFSRQRTVRERKTGWFNDNAASVSAPFDEPTIGTPVTFRGGANDPASRSVATTAAVFLQDRITLIPQIQLLLGVRHERFQLESVNRRSSEELSRADALISPRAGIVLKPADELSLYASHSVSYLPNSGDQFFMVTAATRALEPERFTNREVGLKWEPLPALSFSAAVYRLDRTNTAAPDPTDATRLVQTGSQRSSGFELSVGGSITQAWQVTGGYAAQRARITSTTTAAAAGQVVPLVPERAFSLWNRYALSGSLGAGLGVVHQSRTFAAIDNKVVLPAFTRYDAALFARLTRALSAQLNVENLFDSRYFPTAHNNNNIQPGAPRTLRVSLLTSF